MVISMVGFRALVSQANFWLKNNSGKTVFRVEVIERNAAFSGAIDYNNSIKFEGAFGTIIYVRALR